MESERQRVREGEGEVDHRNDRISGVFSLLVWTSVGSLSFSRRFLEGGGGGSSHCSCAVKG